MRRCVFLISEQLNFARQARIRFTSDQPRLVPGESEPAAHGGFEIGVAFSGHRTGERPDSAAALGERRTHDGGEALDRCNAFRQFAANLLGSEVLVRREAQRGLPCEGNEQSRDFARLFGPVLSRCPGSRGALRKPHLSRDRGRADNGKGRLDRALPNREGAVPTGRVRATARFRRRNRWKSPEHEARCWRIFRHLERFLPPPGLTEQIARVLLHGIGRRRTPAGRIAECKGSVNGKRTAGGEREEQDVHGSVDAKSIFVVVAAFNEACVIGRVIEDLRETYSNVVVVDDGSSDVTADCALTAGAVVLRHPVNLGQGAALQTGITYALARGGAFVATFDADGQHSSADIVALLRALTEHKAEVALGSRFIGNAVGMSMSRRIMLRLAVLLTRLTTGLRVTDAHNGLRLFTRGAARKIRITQNRMAHASEILDQISRHKLVYVEVPVTITYTDHSRAKGQTLLGAADIIGELILGKLARGN
jgi:polyprenyl-phospho-N-acetylgalactosaminyl synthase